MSHIKLPLKALDYSCVDFSEIKSKNQITEEKRLKDLAGIEYYKQKRPTAIITQEAIENKDVDKLTQIYLPEFRDLQLSSAIAKATIYPKGSTKEGVPTKKDNEKFFRKQKKILEKLKVEI